MMQAQGLSSVDAYGRFQAENLLDDLGRYVEVQKHEHVQPQQYHMHQYG